MLFLLFLLRMANRNFILFLLGLSLAKREGFFPVGVVSGQVKELADGFRLDSPYPVDKGLAHSTISESGDDLVDGRVGEFGTALREAANVVTETLALLLPTMVKLASIVGLRVGSLEVPYEGFPELGPDVDSSSGEVLEPSMCGVGHVQRDALDDKQIVGHTAVVVGKVIVLKPCARVGLPIVLCGGGRSMISSWGVVTHKFEDKLECINYMCARIKLHTRNDSVNTKYSVKA
jgi:hypothetical protein